MLGDVGADVVTSALGWFEANVVEAMYTEGAWCRSGQGGLRPGWPRPIRDGAGRIRRRRGSRRHRRRHPGGLVGLEGSAIPLFVGWRGGAPLRQAAGRAAQLIQILREWRGGLHLVATTAVGLFPLEAILTDEGPGQASFFGWSEPFPDAPP